MASFPYKIENDYYRDVGKFADDFIDFSKSLNVDSLSEMLEGLLIGVYWDVYGNDAVALSDNAHMVLSTLSNIRNRFSDVKLLADDVRGLLLTEVYNHKNEDVTLDLDKDNLVLLFNYLESTGDFYYQLPHLKKYEHDITQEKMDLFQSLADWFLQNSSKYLGGYTLGFEEYFKINNDSHISKEDIIFFNSPRELYYLNMLGANLMNRIFKEDFQSRKRKALLLPSCMKISKSKCKAKDTRLGPVCSLCNKNCNVFKIAKDYPYELYLIEHNSDSLKGATKKDLEELGIIGVTCVLNLISGGYQAADMGIPPQCVLLNRVACSKHWLDKDFPSTIDIQELSNKI